MIKIRSVIKKDYNDLNKIFSKNKNHFMDKETWENLWDNPYLNKKKVLGFVLLNNNKLLGHIGFFPSIYLYKKRKIKCIILHSLIIKKKFRSYSFLLLKKLFLFHKKKFYLSTTTNLNAGKMLNFFGFAKMNLKSLNQSKFIILNIKKFISFFLKIKKIFFFNKILVNIIYLFSIMIFLKKNSILEKKKIYHEHFFIQKFDLKFKNFWSKYKKKNKQIVLDRDINYINWLLEKKIKKKKVYVITLKKKKKKNILIFFF